ncbi:MAG: hypothetical protein EVA52_01095 [Gammaproteobacteria bacterium]|jgi:uncharacterized membrane protein|nr:MAG: hypothetical protein EVA52_01095 [Gammaproteobacteria bacterium]
MISNFTKIRKYIGWVLIIVSIILSILGIVVAAMGELVKGGAIYVASQVTWYPGLALLGPEIVQKGKDIWNNLKLKVRGFFK